MRRILLACLLIGGLEGCATSIVVDQMMTSPGRDDAVEVRSGSELRSRTCPRMGDVDRYRIDAKNRPLYLDLERWELSDEPIRSETGRAHSPARFGKEIEVVMGTSSEGYFPSDLAGENPSVLIRYPKGGPAMGADSLQVLSAPSLEIWYWLDGEARWRKLAIRTERFKKARDRAHALERSTFLLLAVPLDVVMWPLELLVSLGLFKGGSWPMGCPGGCT
ncbi:MAG: hypothetical protein IPN71_00200 [Fibrobacteres bacterium]|jgi:hypothetical protein|nr:hypothetical protein [Fibrobacterota bacterium]MBK9576842.1 hypothetical protein [Fibrobacterota bacterium]QQS05880.1 MAG: hypothetical protein IPK50_03075 [Fibrobacterota bacterium]